jgi:hypothetical protein
MKKQQLQNPVSNKEGRVIYNHTFHCIAAISSSQEITDQITEHRSQISLSSLMLTAAKACTTAPNLFPFRFANPLNRLSTTTAQHTAQRRRVATAAGGGSSKRMAEASLSCPYKEVEDGLKKLQQLPGPHYVLFTADPDPATGVSWCPDCVRCSPAVKRVMAEKKASLLEVLVGQRPVWKDPQHPLRYVCVFVRRAGRDTVWHAVEHVTASQQPVVQAPSLSMSTSVPAAAFCCSLCRHDPKIKLSGVPDVMCWGADGPTAKMGADLEKAASSAEAVAAVAAFINSTS